jgi:putative PEP-CTERM system TPR-repeat lipoprotein
MFRKALTARTLIPALIALGAALTPPAPALAQGAPSYVAEAEKLIAGGDLRGAEIQLRNAVRENPDDPSIHVKLAELYLKLVNLPAAEAEARSARDKGGSEDDIAPILAEALLGQNKLAQVIEQVRPADRDPGSESVVRLSLGLAHMGLQEFKEAEPLLNDAARLDPKAWRPKLALARYAMLKGDDAQAQKRLEEARAIAPDSIEVMRFQGEMLRGAGDLEGAVKVFDGILAQYPNDLGALLSRGNVLLVLNRLPDAQRDVDAALKLSPRSIPANYLDALLLAREGQLDKADDLLNKVAPSFGAMPQGYYLQGAIKYALGQYEQADISLTKYLARKPDQAGARRLRALIALRKKEPARAIALLQPVVDANPADTAAMSVLAQAYVAMGKRDDAVRLYESAAKVSPDDASAQTRAALMHVRFGDALEGVTDLEKIAGSDKGANVAGPILVLSEMERGDVAKAASTAEALVKREGDDPIAQNLLGSVRIAQQRFSDAAAIFETLIKKDPDFLAARRNLAVVRRELNDLDGAKQAYLDLLERKPDDLPAMMGLAELAAMSGDTKEAVKRLAKAREIAPRNPAPGERLVQFYGFQRNWDAALKLAQEMEAQFPADPSVVDLAASVRAEMNDLPGAAAEFRALTQKLPNSDMVWWRYAGYQDRAGDKEGARTSLQKALAIAPDNQTYLEDLVKLDFSTKGLDAAVTTARSFSREQPVFSEILVAQALGYSRRYADAISVLTKAQRANPSSLGAVRLALMTYASGNREDARKSLEAWVKDHDGDVGARVGLADLLMTEHDYDGAQAIYEFVHARAPTNVIALNNLAWIYAKKRDARAPEFARQAYRLAPSPQTADTLGWALMSGGDTKGALSYLKRAGAALPQDASIQYHLAVALKASGDKDQARVLLEQALKGTTSFDGKDDAQRLLDELQRG